MSRLALSDSFEYLFYGSTTIIHVLLFLEWGRSLKTVLTRKGLMFVIQKIKFERELNLKEWHKF